MPVAADRLPSPCDPSPMPASFPLLSRLCRLAAQALPGLEPSAWAYWLMMQGAMVVGFATTYPVNWWLIRRGIKERM